MRRDPTDAVGAIKQLEDQLGVILVQRGSRFQGLTPEGQRVLEWARRIVGDARTMREEMKAARKGLSGHARLADHPHRDLHGDGVDGGVCRKTPRGHPLCHVLQQLQVLSRLENFEIDAGITYIDNEPTGRVATVPLYAERYQLITSQGQGMADREQVTWAEVANCRCACSRRTCRTGGSSTSTSPRPEPRPSRRWNPIP
jgi:DNA-binding transcriptional LysR family regulator